MSNGLNKNIPPVIYQKLNKNLNEREYVAYKRNSARDAQVSNENLYEDSVYLLNDQDGYEINGVTPEKFRSMDTPELKRFNPHNSTLGFEKIYIIQNSQDGNSKQERVNELQRKYNVSLRSWESTKISPNMYIPACFLEFFGDHRNLKANFDQKDVEKFKVFSSKSVPINMFMKSYKPLEVDKYPISSKSLVNHQTHMNLYADIVKNNYQTALILHVEDVDHFISAFDSHKEDILNNFPSKWELIAFNTEKNTNKNKLKAEIQRVDLPHTYAVTKLGASKILVNLINDIQNNKVNHFVYPSNKDKDSSKREIRPNEIISHAGALNGLVSDKKVLGYSFKI
ncbi:hypothetical protein BB559_007427 [Furculomyces boomerangus]|uniref:Uncharacterized protein n=2 Tax=Harpellales TaxID=61421 RepID=A0A2T9XXF9_9FUNG|nr:hypothetical protein BB559_007427 [Furculomyces boomerangus]